LSDQPGGGWQPPSGNPPQWQPPPPPQWPPQQQQGGPHWPPPHAPGPQPESSGKAIAALVLGICGIVVCPIILSIAALVLGYQAKGEIERSGGRISGHGNAKAGIVLGWIGLVLWVLFMAAIIALGVSGALDDSYDPYDFDQDFSLSLIRAALT
jgi:hypothetical protein